MDKDRERQQRAGQIATEMLLLADDARRNNRRANGASVLEQAAQDLIEHAANPETRRARIELQELDWLLKP